MSALLLPALAVLCVLLGLRARVDVYAAFVRGAQEGLRTLAGMCPYLAAILMVTALWRQIGLTDALTALLSPLLSAVGLPRETAGVVLLRPLSGSAAMAAARDVLLTAGADSRAGRLACVICGASETVFFTGALYLGAAKTGGSRYAVPAALLAYVSGVLAAAALV